MITSQRVIIYRTDTNHDELDYEITNVFDFSSIANVVVIGKTCRILAKDSIELVLDDDDRRPYVQFLLLNQAHRSNKSTTVSTATATGGNQCQHFILRCDLHDRALRLTRDIQRAREIFEEEKLTYIPPDDADDADDDDDISGEQATDETVQMT